MAGSDEVLVGVFPAGAKAGEMTPGQKATSGPCSPLGDLPRNPQEGL